MGKDFQPWRRDIRWQWAGELPAIKIVRSLSFAAGQRNWAYGLRFGLMPISPEEFGLFLEAVQAQ